MNSMRVLAVVLTFGFVAAGCSSTAVDQTSPVGPPDAYRDNFSPDTRANLRYSDEFQKLDPCGFIDPAIIEKWGTTKHFGNSRQLGDCDVLFDQPVTGSGITGVSMRTGIANVPDGTQVTLPDGTLVSELPDDGSCAVVVQFDDEQSFAYSVTDRANPQLVGSDEVAGALCEDAEALVTASIPLLTTRPLRTDSTRTVLTPAAPADPCAFLNEFDDVDERTLNATLQKVGTCDVYRTAGDEDTRENVSIVQASSRLMRFPLPDANQLLILGVPADEREYREYFTDKFACEITVYIGVDNQYPVQALSGEESWMDALYISGRDCENARKTALAATRQYLSR